jgi:hypothetical protein
MCIAGYYAKDWGYADLRESLFHAVGEFAALMD